MENVHYLSENALQTKVLHQLNIKLGYILFLIDQKK